MKPKLFMVIAGEPSGDLLAAELVKALRAELNQTQPQPSSDLQPLHTSLEPRFFGAGGPRMAEAGVELAFDMTAHAVVGLIEVLKNYGKFRKLFDQLIELALDREPDAIICVDFSGFNRRFAHAIANRVRARQGPFHNWAPRLIQYVSPQVWASREGRAKQMADDFNLLLSIFPFEKEWYAKHASDLKVEYVGHPMLDRYAGFHAPNHTASPLPMDGNGARDLSRRNVPAAESCPQISSETSQPSLLRTEVRAPLPAASLTPIGVGLSDEHRDQEVSRLPLVLLLPGSRMGELRRHLPVLQAASRIIVSRQTVRFRLCLPNQTLADEAAKCEWPASTTIQVGGLPEALGEADLAIASTGTVTMECAYFGVPTVALYKTSWSTYEIAKRLIKVNFLAMPNLLAGDAIYPEFIQHAATPENIARAALDFLENEPRRQATRLKLAKVIRSLGGPGASQRAARAIAQLLSPSQAAAAK